MTKNQIITAVKEIILRHAKPNRIYLYGSVANGTATQNSDIDIAYDDEDFSENYLIKDEVEKLDTLIKIDIQNIAKTEDRFKNRVKSTSKVLYSATKHLRAEDALYNYSQSLERFNAAVDKKDVLEDEGFAEFYLDLVVKRFEFTFEMSWKCMKRYLEFLGLEAKSPRATIKESFAQGILENEAVWLNMIEQRNISSHTYDEYQIAEILDHLQEYKDNFIALQKHIEVGLS